MNFKTWAEQKKVKDQDLVFQRALKFEAQRMLFERLADQMAQFSPSFSDGISFLEVATDLILMGYSETLFEKCSNFTTWKNQLHGLRYPISTSRDLDLKQRFETLPWPYGSKVKFERRGDRAGVELRVFISSASDVIKIKAALERVQQDLES